jgi:tetratricopeptide (TPR) repeat protein
LSFYEAAIASATELGDLPYSDLGTMLNNIAMMYRKSGRQKAAEPYYLHALELYEKQLGPEHADVASVLNNLAVFYTNERRYAEAEETHLRALAIREKIHPAAHPDIRAIEMQPRGRLPFARRLSARLGAVSRVVARVGRGGR